MSCACSIASLLVSATALAETSGFVQIQSRADIDPGREEIFFDTGLNRPLNEDFDLNVYSLLTRGWGELLAGSTYHISETFSAGLMLGGEQGGYSGLKPRSSLCLAAQTGDFAAFGMLELNEDGIRGRDEGYWYVGRIEYDLTEPLTLGVMIRRPDGVGPYASWAMGSMKTWVAWTPFLPEKADWHTGRLVSGIGFAL